MSFPAVRIRALLSSFPIILTFFVLVLSKRAVVEQATSERRARVQAQMDLVEAKDVLQQVRAHSPLPFYLTFDLLTTD